MPSKQVGFLVDFCGPGPLAVRRAYLYSGSSEDYSLWVRIPSARHLRRRAVVRTDLFPSRQDALNWLALFLLTHGGRRQVLLDTGAGACNWVVAFSARDAAAVYAQDGYDFDSLEYEGRPAGAIWTPCRPDDTLCIWCDARGSPTEPESPGSRTETHTMRWWSDRVGRGLLASSEY